MYNSDRERTIWLLKVKLPSSLPSQPSRELQSPAFSIKYDEGMMNCPCSPVTSVSRPATYLACPRVCNTAHGASRSRSPWTPRLWPVSRTVSGHRKQAHWHYQLQGGRNFEGREKIYITSVISAVLGRKSYEFDFGVNCGRGGGNRFF